MRGKRNKKKKKLDLLLRKPRDSRLNKMLHSPNKRLRRRLPKKLLRKLPDSKQKQRLRSRPCLMHMNLRLERNSRLNTRRSKLMLSKQQLLQLLQSNKQSMMVLDKLRKQRLP